MRIDLKILISVIFNIFSCVFVVNSAANGQTFVHLTISSSSKYFFAMEDSDSGIGSCYEMISSKAFKPRWATKGWYSAPDTMHLSNDGAHLVRIHLISSKHANDIKSDTPAIDFYANGISVKHVKIEELLQIEKLKSLKFDKIEKFIFSGKLVYLQELGDLLSDKDWIKLLERKDENSIQHYFCETILGDVIVYDIKNGSVIFRGHKRISPVGLTVEDIFRSPESVPNN